MRTCRYGHFEIFRLFDIGGVLWCAVARSANILHPLHDGRIFLA